MRIELFFICSLTKFLYHTIILSNNISFPLRSFFLWQRSLRSLYSLTPSLITSFQKSRFTRFTFYLNFLYRFRFYPPTIWGGCVDISSNSFYIEPDYCWQLEVSSTFRPLIQRLPFSASILLFSVTHLTSFIRYAFMLFDREPDYCWQSKDRIEAPFLMFSPANQSASLPGLMQCSGMF